MSDAVARYNCTDRDALFRDPDGPLVQYTDHAVEVERLREALAQLLDDWDEHGALTWDALHSARTTLAGGGGEDASRTV